MNGQQELQEFIRETIEELLKEVPAEMSKEGLSAKEIVNAKQMSKAFPDYWLQETTT